MSFCVLYTQLNKAQEYICQPNLAVKSQIYYNQSCCITYLQHIHKKQADLKNLKPCKYSSINIRQLWAPVWNWRWWHPPHHRPCPLPQSHPSLPSDHAARWLRSCQGHLWILPTFVSQTTYHCIMQRGHWDTIIMKRQLLQATIPVICS